ncbi:MAG: hypothetical protein PHC85_01720 [Candidatus Pacebacteria bacterium]|nr:hypothetical protein [Candidatus Paceibacterota bacterium]
MEGGEGMNEFIADKTNPLHVYCRLRDAGINKKWARKISVLYEKTIFTLIKSFSKFNGSPSLCERKKYPNIC